ncbi:MAG: hypothetical protein P8010_04895 [Desulfosarcinaceae bacterium]
MAATPTSTPAEMSRRQPEHKPPVRLRAVVIGSVIALSICALTPFNNTYRQATPLGGGHFPLAPFYILIWLTLVVGVVNHFRKGRPLLSGSELLLAWGLMVLVSGVAYTGLVRTFFINLTAPFHFATVENRWADTLQPLLPAGLFPTDKGAIAELYNGLEEGRRLSWWAVLGRIPWQAWIGPLVAWGGFVLLCYWVMVCIVTLLAPQALVNERMNFPLLRVPQLMEAAVDAGQSQAFWSNPFLLVGIAIPVALHLLNGLSFYFPSVPQLPTLILAGSYFPKVGLFSGFIKLKIFIYPAFIGFAFLAAKQISFSFWFFFLAGGLLYGLLALLGYQIPAAALGVTFGPTLSRPEEMQMVGAFLAFLFFLIWLARFHFTDVLREAFFLKPASCPANDWFSMRSAFWGAVAGAALLVLWFHLFGMSVGVALVVLGAFFIFSLVAMRVICQGGVAYFTLTAAPLDGILAIFGPQFFTHAGLILTGVAQKVLFVDLRESLMPSLLHLRKISGGMGGRKLIRWSLLALLFLSVVVSFSAMLALCYKYGVRELQLDWASRTTLNVYENLNTLVTTPIRPGRWVTVFAVVGAVVMVTLILCYHRFYWWPLHPIGYLMTYSSAMRILWFSFFVGWLANALCMRYGGVVLFKKIRFFFIGLIIGDFLMGGSWALVGLFSQASYQVLPT